MTTSGTSTFNETRNQIIKAALRKCGAIEAGETPGAQTIRDASDQLNAMVKHWSASGIHIWTTMEAVLFTQINQAQYVLGTNASSQTAEVYTQTTLQADVDVGALVIVVASNSNVVVGVTIGVTLDAGTIFWTTVAAVSGTTVTLAAAMTDSSTLGDYVYITSPNIERPLRMPAARRWDQVSNIETALIPLARLDYDALPNKNALGTVTQFYYNPRGGATNAGLLFLWPTPNNTTSNAIKFTWYRPIQDFNAPGDTPDLPQEWINTLIWNLAMEMSPEYGVPMEYYGIIKDRAESTLELVQGWDREPEPTYFGVNFNQMSYGR